MSPLTCKFHAAGDNATKENVASAKPEAARLDSPPRQALRPAQHPWSQPQPQAHPWGAPLSQPQLQPWEQTQPMQPNVASQFQPLGQSQPQNPWRQAEAQPWRQLEQQPAGEDKRLRSQPGASAYPAAVQPAVPAVSTVQEDEAWADAVPVVSAESSGTMVSSQLHANDNQWQTCFFSQQTRT